MPPHKLRLAYFTLLRRYIFFILDGLATRPRTMDHGPWTLTFMLRVNGGAIPSLYLKPGMFGRASSFVRRAKSIRPDTLAVLSIFGGCSLVLAEAYTRSDLGDAQSAADASYGPTDDIITSDHVRTLERNGVVVIPNALSKQGLINARGDIARYAKYSSSGFEISGVGGESSNEGEAHTEGTVRQDLVSWLRRPTTDTDANGKDDTSDEDEPIIGRSLLHCIDLIRGVASTLDHYGYTDSRSHKVPRQCQLALYKGDGRSGYARHLDRCGASLQELGLLEYMRLSDFRGRAVTVILYLNDASRTKQDGGALRCWLKKDNFDVVQQQVTKDDEGNTSDECKGEKFGAPFDIQPTGGSLLIFHSDRLEHQVLASFKDRYALTVWVNGDLC